VNTATVVAIISTIGTILGVVFTRTRGSKRLDALERLDALRREMRDREEDTTDTYVHIFTLEQVLSRQLLEYYDSPPWKTWLYYSGGAAVVGAGLLVASHLRASILAFGVKDVSSLASEIHFRLAWAGVSALLISIVLAIVSVLVRVQSHKISRRSK
jgi:hypothetical protein